jgi:hypothetical protein
LSRFAAKSTTEWQGLEPMSAEGGDLRVNR